MTRNSLRGRLYTAIARVSAHLPNVRGRTRIFLELYRILGLSKKHVVVVDARLSNIGLIAIPFMLMADGESARVVAVEAVPDNVEVLRRNVKANHLESASAMRRRRSISRSKAI